MDKRCNERLAFVDCKFNNFYFPRNKKNMTNWCFCPAPAASACVHIRPNWEKVNNNKLSPCKESYRQSVAWDAGRVMHVLADNNKSVKLWSSHLKINGDYSNMTSYRIYWFLTWKRRCVYSSRNPKGCSSFSVIHTWRLSCSLRRIETGV